MPVTLVKKELTNVTEFGVLEETSDLRARQRIVWPNVKKLSAVIAVGAINAVIFYCIGGLFTPKT